MPFLPPAWLGALACAVNFGSLLFNAGFTRAAAITALDSNVFSTFGQFMVLVWGVAFAAAGARDDGRSLVWFAFAVEKSAYVAVWATWHFSHDITAVWSDAQKSGDVLDLLAPAFIILYGVVDLTFFLLFMVQGLAALAPPATKKKR